MYPATVRGQPVSEIGQRHAALHVDLQADLSQSTSLASRFYICQVRQCIAAVIWCGALLHLLYPNSTDLTGVTAASRLQCLGG